MTHMTMPLNRWGTAVQIGRSDAIDAGVVAAADVHAMPKLLQRPWTPEEDEALRVAIEQGVSRQRLAVRFSRQVRAIEVRARALGIVPKLVQRLAYTERIFDGQSRPPRTGRQQNSF